MNCGKVFNFTARYLDDLLNMKSPYFEKMVSQIYPHKLQLNKADSDESVAPFLDLGLDT